MSRVIAVLAIAIGVSAVAACVGGAATRTPSGQWVAVQTAARGELTPIAGTSREYRLVLRGVAPTVKSFDDSPGDGAGDVPVRTLLGELFGGQDAPMHNAGITVGARTMAVTLLGGTYDRRSRTMRYRVRALRGGDRLPRRFARPALFIDDIGDAASSVSCYTRFTVPVLMTWTLDALVTPQPANSSWVKQPTQIGSNLVEWATSAASPTAPCGSEVDLGVGLSGQIGTVVHVEVQATSSDDPNPTLICQLSGTLASTYTCTATVLPLGSNALMAWFQMQPAS